MLTDTAGALSSPPSHPDKGMGRAMHDLIAELYPICRSITGQGVRATLQRLAKILPLELHEVPTGTSVFDWEVPPEWNIRGAYIRNSKGRTVVDFRHSNLYVVGYSIPVAARLELSELKKHLYTLPDRPEWIPYRTSYYTRDWGFCLPHRQMLELEEGEYEVFIDSSLTNGSLTYAECRLEGQTNDEVLISTHLCHPSLCNDNLSGIAVAAFLAKALSACRLRYSYRFVFLPGTIGPITWLARNESVLPEIRHGMVLTGLGDPGSITYKRSRRGDAEIDRAVMHVLQRSGRSHRVVDFSPYGYDERQYCSPGINLPVGCLTRSQPGTYPEYHTSADDLHFVSPEQLSDSLSLCLAVLRIIENNRLFLNRNPKCEPQLGRRGLYTGLGGQTETKTKELSMLWVLNFSDGQHALLDIAERSGLDFEAVRAASESLQAAGLLLPIGTS